MNSNRKTDSIYFFASFRLRHNKILQKKNNNNNCIEDSWNCFYYILQLACISNGAIVFRIRIYTFAVKRQSHFEMHCEQEYFIILFIPNKSFKQKTFFFSIHSLFQLQFLCVLHRKNKRCYCIFCYCCCSFLFLYSCLSFFIWLGNIFYFNVLYLHRKSKQ